MVQLSVSTLYTDRPWSPTSTSTIHFVTYRQTACSSAVG